MEGQKTRIDRGQAKPSLAAFCEALERHVGQQRYSMWFGGAESSDGSVGIEVRQANGDPTAGTPITGATTEVVVRTSTPFEQALIRKQFGSDLEAAATDSISATYRIVYQSVISSSETPGAKTPVRGLRKTRIAEAQASAAALPPEQAAASVAPPVRKPINGWVVGEGNAAATRLCSRMIAGVPGPSPTLLWGPSGVGKTTLLRTVAEGFRARKRRVLSITAEQFLRGFVDAARSGGFPSFRQKHQGVDLLIVDDVQQLLGKARTVEEFRQTIDSLIESGAQILLSADRGPNQLRELGPEITSRLAGGLSVEVAMPDADMREKLVNQAAARVGFELPASVARTLACRLLGGGREISGAINRMALLHETFETPLDDRFANQVADDANRLSTPPVRLADIQEAVCSVFGVDSKTLRSDKRTKAVTEPRMLAMYLARNMTGSAWSEIGSFFGRKSHSTVIAAHRRVEALLASPEPKQLMTGDLGETLRRIEATLRSA